ncbi:uncharacterized protein LOC132706198 [Cylas formicarius]|uniref:uncharacterized protein LOC132706198 n=1 Tax=Cylas formicarius TaxID=197179 RepID=UPI0029588444|nr:uncharacterized protein LOC132706198 [Cylas formicarius]XP_060533367.1 uncharacterized protein LOC132706198 [Cylas formicarius]
MDLEKRLNKLDGKLSHFSRKGTNGEKNWQLVGFKDNLAVLGPTEVEKQPLLKKVQVDTDPDSGQKFIKLNGKKLKVISQDQIPKEVRKKAMLVKHRTINIGSSDTPLTVRVISKVTQVNAQAFKLQDQATDKNSALSTQDKASHKPTINDLKYKHICAAKQLVKELVNPTPRVTYKLLSNKTLEVLNNVKMKALNLSRKRGNNSDVNVKIDKCIQTELGAVKESSCQTDHLFDCPELPFGNLDFLFDLDNSEDSPILNNVSLGVGPKITPIMGGKVVSSGSSACWKGQSVTLNSKKQFFEDLNVAMIPNENGNLPIHVGVLTNNVDLVKRMCVVLRARKIDVNVENHDGCTPLQLSIIKNAGPNVVCRLLDYGADVSDCDGDGNNVIHLAAKFRRKNLLEVILFHNRFKELYARCLNDFSFEGLTPLMICCLSGWTDGVKTFLRHRAKVNLRDQKSGRTALFHASEIHSAEIVRLLLQNGADPKVKNFFGTSPHDAMYELDTIPTEIKNLIFSKTKKRSSEAELNPARTSKAAKLLKTYPMFKKIDKPEAFG